MPNLLLLHRVYILNPKEDENIMGAVRFINQLKKYHILLFHALVLMIVVTDLALDIVKDLPRESLLLEIIIEGSILLLVITSSNYIWNILHKVENSNTELERDLISTQERATTWERKSKEFIKEFQSHLTDQFNKWNLTKSEQEIALLLLKGNSAKDISELRRTSLGTIKNQCRSIYEKSGQSNKSELSAYFLGELLPDL